MYSSCCACGRQTHTAGTLTPPLPACSDGRWVLASPSLGDTFCNQSSRRSLSGWGSREGSAHLCKGTNIMQNVNSNVKEQVQHDSTRLTLKLFHAKQYYEQSVSQLVTLTSLQVLGCVPAPPQCPQKPPPGPHKSTSEASETQKPLHSRPPSAAHSPTAHFRPRTDWRRSSHQWPRRWQRRRLGVRACASRHASTPTHPQHRRRRAEHLSAAQSRQLLFFLFMVCHNKHYSLISTSHEYSSRQKYTQDGCLIAITPRKVCWRLPEAAHVLQHITGGTRIPSDCLLTNSLLYKLVIV